MMIGRRSVGLQEVVAVPCQGRSGGTGASLGCLTAVGVIRSMRGHLLQLGCLLVPSPGLGRQEVSRWHAARFCQILLEANLWTLNMRRMLAHRC